MKKYISIIVLVIVVMTVVISFMLNKPKEVIINEEVIEQITEENDIIAGSGAIDETPERPMSSYRLKGDRR